VKVRDQLLSIPDQVLDLDAASIVLVCATERAPTVYSTVPSGLAKQLLSLLVEHGDWSDSVRLDH
jgi:hypothetical protein